MKVQLNHPGVQKGRGKSAAGFSYHGTTGTIVRNWNSDTTHYRKFLASKGYFLENAEQQEPDYGTLHFWGEWEGYSDFQPFGSGIPKTMPNGLHTPFHCIVSRGSQNTDPFVFGDSFFYCICKQRGRMQSLTTGSLILFGTVYPKLNQFHLDTVFVVSDRQEPSANVRSNGGASYSPVYKEATLEQLDEYLNLPGRVNSNKVYHGVTWWENKEVFSFSPCKPEVSNHSGYKGFPRLTLDLSDPRFGFSRYPAGISYLLGGSTTDELDLWKIIVDECFRKGLKLGIRFDEPATRVKAFTGTPNPDDHDA